MNGIKPQQLDNCKRRIGQRLEESTSEDRGQPMFNPENVHYEMAERARGLAAGGIGAVHQLALKIGLVDRIDRDLHLLKIHRPYHESDHVLNIALNVMAGGECLEDLELRRNDEVFLDALGTQRIPDPTTAGDFCRRFSEGDVRALMDAIDETRLEIWKQQSDDFFDEAIIDMDGTMVPTTGECKEGMDISTSPFLTPGAMGSLPALADTSTQHVSTSDSGRALPSSKSRPQAASLTSNL